jgi:hypothetical protein
LYSDAEVSCSIQDGGIRKMMFFDIFASGPFFGVQRLRAAPSPRYLLSNSLRNIVW